MANTPPPNPQNLQNLIALRDRLDDYLATVERNIDAVNGWLAENKNKIIVNHQRLNRALKAKNDTQATALLKSMGDSAGFVTSFQDFKTAGEKAFGRDSAFLKALAAVKPGLPAALRGPLPDISGIDAKALSQFDPDNAPQKDDKWWGSVSGWFHQDEKRREEQMRETRRQFHAVKSEILGLQSDRHYYIDSLMDWVGDTLEPEAPGGNNSAKMLQYKNFDTIIKTADADYQAAVKVTARGIHDLALQYSELADAIDGQDAQTILKKITLAYPAQRTEESYLLHSILLEDYQSLSLPELILKHISKRDAQAELLEWACVPDRQLILLFSDAETPQQIFEKFAQLTLDKKSPLEPKILGQVMSLLQLQKAPVADFAFPPHGEPNILQRIAMQFADSFPAQEKAMWPILNVISGRATGSILPQYIRLAASLRFKDVSTARQILGNTASAAELTAFWRLCQPNVSLLDSLRNLSADPAEKAALLEGAVNAGILGELNMAGPDSAEAARKFKKLLEDDILPALDKFPVTTARLLIAHSFPAAGDFSVLRGWLTQAPENWLAKIAASPIDNKLKSEWIAVGLAPFKSDIVKANVLEEAARASTGSTAAVLSRLEKNLVGENIRLTEDKILCHLPRIANIWYNAASKMLRYTVRGQSHTLLENVTPAMAQEYLSLIRRRGGFMQEQDGLFRPENIDAIHYTPQETSISWYHVTGSLNADPVTLAQLQSRKDFLQVSDAAGKPISSYNAASICLLQKLDNGSSVMIDKYGVSHLLEGAITLPKNSGLVDLGAAYFNPDNASIIRLLPEQNAMEFRIESPEFEKLLDGGAEEFFYGIKTSPAKFAALKNALAANPDIHSPNKAELSKLHLNMKALGYLSYADEGGVTGFYCKRYGANRKPGFIQVDPALGEAILDGIGVKAGILKTGTLLTHRDSIDDAYYSAGKNKLQCVIDNEIQEVSLPAVEGWGALLQLAADKKFTTVSSEKGTLKDMPTDVVQIDRATLLTRDAAQGKVNVITEHMPFHFNMSGAEALDFLDTLEKEGLAAAKRESRPAAWTQNISRVLESLPELNPRPSATSGADTPKGLLNQALGQAEDKDMREKISIEKEKIEKLIAQKKKLSRPTPTHHNGF